MGVGPAALTLYAHLARDKVLAAGRVCDVGSQDVVPENFDPAELSVAFGGVDVRPLSGVSSRALMERLGFEYSCIDLDGRHGAIVADLNLYYEPEMIAPFDVVTNHGTTEHVFDQANCFRLIHDLTRVGGLMIHVVPTRPYANHGFYLYDINLFRDLARENDYEIVRLYEWPDQFGVLLCAALRRVTAAAFRKPMQGSYRHLRVAA